MNNVHDEPTVVDFTAKTDSVKDCFVFATEKNAIKKNS